MPLEHVWAGVSKREHVYEVRAQDRNWYEMQLKSCLSNTKMLNARHEIVCTLGKKNRDWSEGTTSLWKIRCQRTHRKKRKRCPIKQSSTLVLRCNNDTSIIKVGPHQSILWIYLSQRHVHLPNIDLLVRWMYVFTSAKVSRPVKECGSLAGCSLRQR